MTCQICPKCKTSSRANRVFTSSPYYAREICTVSLGDAVTQHSSRLEDRLARVQSPRNDALQAHRHLLPDGEQRSDDRKISAQTSFISFKGYATPVPCKVIDQSKAGARLKLLNDPKLLTLDANDLPERVTLRLHGSNSELQCQVRWRMGVEFGIRFMPNSKGE